MLRSRTVECAERVGQRVRVSGWIHSIRRLGGITFLVLRDGWGTIQAVTEEETQRLLLAELGVESVVSVEGTVTAMPKAPGGIELQGLEVEVVSAVTEPPPVLLHKKGAEANLNVLLDHAVVTNRHPARRAVFKLAAAAMAGFRETLSGLGATEIQSPKLVGQATEGGAEVFRVGYFEREAYLAQSPQLYKQIMVGVFERVFEVAPVFRAEPHASARHLNEYVSLDVEIGFVESHRTVMAFLREVLAGIFAALERRARTELELLSVRLPVVPEKIPELTFTEALEIAREPVGELDLSPAGERALGRWALEEHGSELLFVTGYPMKKRPFYTHPDPARPELSNSFDLLFRGLELVTGGQRLHRHEDYLAALAGRGLAAGAFEHYLEAFRFGMPPHGGFAIGLERLVAQLAGLGNVRLAALFPRDVNRLAP
ncbi:MAG TPA: aspartate--tRNA(Asn) ligase [Planctomycetota bacterium]|nr:aspartate--tRNA(Asn) ligase [Planctomycetota bacterium]